MTCDQVYNGMESLTPTTSDMDVTTSSDLQPLCMTRPPKTRSMRLKNFLAGNPGFCITVVCLGLFIGLLAFVVKCAVRKHQTPQHHDIVTTPTLCGMVMGDVDENVFAFKGIPYALPPIDNKRWLPTEAVVTEEGTCVSEAQHNDVYEAFTYGTECVQKNEINQEMEGSEDCLYINVWTPRIDHEAKLDVMLYVHGGHLMTGSGHQPGLSPGAETAANYNKVFVSFNYRLNVFGFLAIPELASSSQSTKASGNYGLMDQRAALLWVKHNIHYFGGDAEKVTLFGEGSGATSILALMAAESSQTLFQKAWLASPSPKLESVPKFQKNTQFVDSSGCTARRDVVACLRELTTKQVLDALPWEQWRNVHFQQLPQPQETSISLIVVDGWFLKRSPLEAWRSGKMADIPLLVGSSAQEVDDHPSPAEVGAWNWTTYLHYVKQQLGVFDQSGDHQSYLAQSMYAKNEWSPEHQLTSMVSDMRAICPLNELLSLQGIHGRRPVYRYVTWRFPDGVVQSYNGAVYAFHAVDMYAFYGTLYSAAEMTSKRDMQYEQLVQKTVLEFASAGKLSDWQSFQNATAVIEADVNFVEDYNRDKCDVWRLKGIFPEYAWMN